MRELDSNFFRSLAGSPDVSALFPTRGPQQGDSQTVLLGKVAASLTRLTAGLRGGLLYDEGGRARKVRNSGPKNIAASQTDSAVIAAVPGYAIRAISVFALPGATATNLTFNSKPAGAGSAISSLLANAANGELVLPRNSDGWFQTLVGEGLTVTTGAGATTGLQVNYILIPNYLTDEDGLVLFDENGEPLIAE